MLRDLVCGAVGLTFAAFYYRAADALPTSLLSDAVGADGMPKALAVSLALVSGLVALRALAPRPASAGDEVRPLDHLRAFGIIALGAAYAAATPIIGYPLAVAALIAVTALYFGMPPHVGVVGVAALGALLLWALFAKLLGVAMPPGLWPRLIG